MKTYQFFELIKNGNIINIYFKWKNASDLSYKLLSELNELINDLDDNDIHTVIVFRNLGVSELLEHNLSALALSLEKWAKWEKFLLKLEKFAGASVACIDGICNYFHFYLMLACDYRIVTDISSFQISEIRQGYLPGMSLFRLAKYTGLGIAKQMALTGRSYNAKQATDFGIVNQICKPSEFEMEINLLCKTFCTINSDILLYSRRLLNESFSSSPEDAIGHFLAAQDICLSEKLKKT